MKSPFIFKCMFVLVIISTILLPQTSAQKFQNHNLKINNDTPIIQVEKRQYQVNDNVFFYGEKFDNFEQITIFIREIDNSKKENIVLANWIIFADIEGKSTFNWQIPYKGNFEITTVGNNTKTEVRTTVSSLVPVPVVIAGNPNCATLNASTNPAFAHITSDFGFKLNNNNPNGTFPFINSPGFPTELTGGAPADAGNSITATTTNSNRDLAWTSTRPITAVIVKGGPLGSNVYPYNPASLGDPGPLNQPSGTGISHVEFCFQPIAKIIIIKHATPSSTQQFDFTASPGLTPSAFSLIDNSIGTDPMQMFTVTDFNLKTITETNTGPYTLASINCTVDIGTGGTPTPTRIGNAIEIDIKAGDQVTCTFNNDFLTAANVSVSGRVVDSLGYGLGRAYVSATDGNGNVQTVVTNQFGYYTLDGVEAGNTYFFSVQHRSYQFASQAMTISEDMNNLNFSAAPTFK